MFVLRTDLDARQLHAAGLEIGRLVHAVLHGDDFILEVACFERLEIALLTAQREAVDLVTRHADVERQIVGRLAHRHRRGVVERRPQHVDELRLSQLKALPRAEGRERKPAHRLGSRAEDEVCFAERDLLRRRADDLDARPADALHHQRRNAQTHAAVQPDVPWEKQTIRARLPDVRDDDLVDVGGIHLRRLHHGLGAADAEVRGRHARQ
jgi:hypothetical protein